MAITVIDEITAARKAAKINQTELAHRAGVSRVTVQQIESHIVDPRFSTLDALARSLGMSVILVPAALRTDLEEFIQAGGRMLGQREGINAPVSIVQSITGPRRSS